MYSPSLREKCARFSLSAILVPITHRSSSPTATTTPAAEATTIPTAPLRRLGLVILLLVYIATFFLLIATVISPLLVTHVPVLLVSTVPYVTVGRHLLAVSSRLLLLLTVYPILRGERSQELSELLGCHIPQPSGHGR